MHKQAILVRQDLKMKAGKIAAQAAHASLEAALKSEKKLVEAWRSQGAGKIVLKVADEEELLKYKQLADDAKLKSALIRDAGHTQVKPGSITCLGIGPDSEDKISKVTGSLKLL